ncbi:MAG: dTDP-4-dehydrorhamnose 3,5-epimerase family protein [Bdellovibrionales bacterium]|nr:dTDP-4-dehydrorhamnose 3,5-epimerase family protein [Bdellovibrionales bacterium]
MSNAAKNMIMSFPNDNEIHGVFFKELKTWPDDRGFFREIIRQSDSFFDSNGFKQWSHSKMGKDVVKAWHYHHKQTDWWYLTMGCVEAVLYDNREDSPTYKQKLVFRMGELEDGGVPICVKIPPGVLHGCRVLTDFAHLFYITSEEYDSTDEGRIPYDAQEIGHDWGSEAIVSANDQKYITPAAPRPKLTLV